MNPKETFEESIYKKALEQWGEKAQMIAALEELSELQTEIAKHLNGKRSDYIGMIDELADSIIMIEQLIFIFNLKSRVDFRKMEKLQRLQKILNGFC